MVDVDTGVHLECFTSITPPILSARIGGPERMAVSTFPRPIFALNIMAISSSPDRPSLGKKMKTSSVGRS